MRLSIIQTNDPALIQQIGELRANVWFEEKGDEFQACGAGNCWLDIYDAEAFHWVALDAHGKPVAAARLTLHESLDDVPNALAYKDRHFSGNPRTASFNRLVVDPKYRGRGLSREFDRLRYEFAADYADIVVALPVGRSRAKSLAQIGFLSFGEIEPSARYEIFVRNISLTIMAAPLNEAAATYLEQLNPVPHHFEKGIAVGDSTILD